VHLFTMTFSSPRMDCSCCTATGTLFYMRSVPRCFRQNKVGISVSEELVGESAVQSS
jgi:hypothetical protein